MSEPESEGLESARITITSRLTLDGDETVSLELEPHDLPIVTVLGLLEMSKDSALRATMDDED